MHYVMKEENLAAILQLIETEKRLTVDNKLQENMLYFVL